MSYTSCATTGFSGFPFALVGALWRIRSVEDRRKPASLMDPAAAMQNCPPGPTAYRTSHPETRPARLLPGPAAKPAKERQCSLAPPARPASTSRRPELIPDRAMLTAPARGWGNRANSCDPSRDRCIAERSPPPSARRSCRRPPGVPRRNLSGASDVSELGDTEDINAAQTSVLVVVSWVVRQPSRR